MAMLSYDEVKERKYIVYEGQPFECLTSHVFRKQQRKPVNATKLKNLLTGKVTEVSFHVSDKIEEAEIENKEVKYLYSNKGEYMFCDAKDPSKRFPIPADIIGPGIKFLKPNTIVDLLTFGDSDSNDAKIVGVKIPIKVDLKVTEAHDAVRGNTAQGATKVVTVETGATVNVPMFIKEGEVIRINTETGDYVERANGGF
jgi:elongation factor P